MQTETRSRAEVLPPDVAGDHQRLARFQREAEMLASLNHPHIAQIYGIEETTGTTALVMELVEGEDRDVPHLVRRQPVGRVFLVRHR